jgi:CheY-like chemotaxis protein
MPTKIYMLEDDTDDRYLTNEVVDELGLEISIEYFSSSTDLMKALEKNTPAIILADYNSSPENGLEVLSKLKTTSASGVPCVILTENNYPGFKAKCYAAGASSVITKPRDMVQTRQKIRTFFEYWMNVVDLKI